MCETCALYRVGLKGLSRLMLTPGIQCGMLKCPAIQSAPILHNIWVGA